MAKVKVTYDLDISDIDDLHLYRRLNKSLDMALALWDIVYNLKKSIGRELDAKNALEEHYDVLDSVFVKIHEVLDEHSIRIDDLII